MNYRTVYSAVIAIALAAAAAAPASGEDAKPKNKTLLDFTAQDVERDGAELKVNKRYAWASGDWDKKILFLDGRGLLVEQAGGKGNMGGDKQLKLGEYDYAYLIIVIGNRNQAGAIGVKLIDSDGTEARWNFPLAGKPVGTPLVCKMPLAKPDAEEKPGKKPGLDKNRIKQWQITGDWQDAKVEILLVKLGAAS